MGKRVLILSGPTREYIDPVRFISNASSGRMGQALVCEAAARGYAVDFVTGPVEESMLPEKETARIFRIVSTEEMLEAARPLFPEADIVLFAAAPADYAPETRSERKRPKEEVWLLRLRATPDIARVLCRGKRPDQKAVGFALQSHDGEAAARRKLAAKGFDAIVLNGPSAIGAEEAEYRWLQAGSDRFEDWGRLTKAHCARRIFDAIEKMFRSSRF